MICGIIHKTLKQLSTSKTKTMGLWGKHVFIFFFSGATVHIGPWPPQTSLSKCPYPASSFSSSLQGVKIVIDNEIIEQVFYFKYLGNIILSE